MFDSFRGKYQLYAIETNDLQTFSKKEGETVGDHVGIYQGE